MKIDLNYLASILPIIIAACVILLLAIYKLFDDRYIKKTVNPEFRLVSNKEFLDYQKLVSQSLTSFEDKLADIQKTNRKD